MIQIGEYDGTVFVGDNGPNGYVTHANIRAEVGKYVVVNSVGQVYATVDVATTPNSYQVALVLAGQSIAADREAGV